MTSTAGTTQPIAPTRTVGARILVLVAAAVVAVALNTVIAVAAHALGASAEFKPLQLGAYSFLTIVGMLAATAGWALVRARTRNPAGVLRWLVPVVLVLSFVPDLAVLAGGTWPGTSAGAVAALALMHVAVAAVTVPALVRALPLRRR